MKRSFLGGNEEHKISRVESEKGGADNSHFGFGVDARKQSIESVNELREAFLQSLRQTEAASFFLLLSQKNKLWSIKNLPSTSAHRCARGLASRKQDSASADVTLAMDYSVLMALLAHSKYLFEAHSQTNAWADALRTSKSKYELGKFVVPDEILDSHSSIASAESLVSNGGLYAVTKWLQLRHLRRTLAELLEENLDTLSLPLVLDLLRQKRKLLQKKLAVLASSRSLRLRDSLFMASKRGEKQGVFKVDWQGSTDANEEQRAADEKRARDFFTTAHTLLLCSGLAEQACDDLLTIFLEAASEIWILPIVEALEPKMSDSLIFQTLWEVAQTDIPCVDSSVGRLPLQESCILSYALQASQRSFIHHIQQVLRENKSMSCEERRFWSLLTVTNFRTPETSTELSWLEICIVANRFASSGLKPDSKAAAPLLGAFIANHDGVSFTVSVLEEICVLGKRAAMVPLFCGLVGGDTAEILTEKAAVASADLETFETLALIETMILAVEAIDESRIFLKRRRHSTMKGSTAEESEPESERGIVQAFYVVENAITTYIHTLARMSLTDCVSSWQFVTFILNMLQEDLRVQSLGDILVRVLAETAWASRDDGEEYRVLFDFLDVMCTAWPRGEVEAVVGRAAVTLISEIVTAIDLLERKADEASAAYLQELHSQGTLLVEAICRFCEVPRYECREDKPSRVKHLTRSLSMITHMSLACEYLEMYVLDRLELPPLRVGRNSSDRPSVGHGRASTNLWGVSARKDGRTSVEEQVEQRAEPEKVIWRVEGKDILMLAGQEEIDENFLEPRVRTRSLLKGNVYRAVVLPILQALHSDAEELRDADRPTGGLAVPTDVPSAYVSSDLSALKNEWFEFICRHSSTLYTVFPPGREPLSICLIPLQQFYTLLLLRETIDTLKSLGVRVCNSSVEESTMKSVQEWWKDVVSDRLYKENGFFRVCMSLCHEEYCNVPVSLNAVNKIKSQVTKTWLQQVNSWTNRFVKILSVSPSSSKLSPFLEYFDNTLN